MKNVILSSAMRCGSHTILNLLQVLGYREPMRFMRFGGQGTEMRDACESHFGKFPRSVIKTHQANPAAISKWISSMPNAVVLAPHRNLADSIVSRLFFTLRSAQSNGFRGDDLEALFLEVGEDQPELMVRRAFRECPTLLSWCVDWVKHQAVLDHPQILRIPFTLLNSEASQGLVDKVASLLDLKSFSPQAASVLGFDLATQLHQKHHMKFGSAGGSSLIDDYGWKIIRNFEALASIHH